MSDLMQKLALSKAIMDKAEGIKRGSVQNINQPSVSEFNVPNAKYNIPSDILEQSQPQQKNFKDTKQPTIDAIKNSKLPDAIKKAMIENPIPQISLNDTLDMDVVKGAKRLMEQEGVSSKKTQPQQRQSVSTNIDMSAIATLVENTVRKVLDEKLNQILTAQQTQSINENLVLKVGDSVFKGKITGVNKSK